MPNYGQQPMWKGETTSKKSWNTHGNIWAGAGYEPRLVLKDWAVGEFGANYSQTYADTINAHILLGIDSYLLSFHL